MKTFFHLRAAAALGLVLLAAALPGWGQTLTLANWSIDVFSPSPTFGLADGNPRTPCFTNNGIAQSTLYANCPLGAPLKLAAAGDGIFCTGQAVITGDVNADGNLQFRFGLFFQGNHPADTNWLGYLFGNYVGNHEGAASALMVRNNPNPGIYATGYPGNIMRPKCGQVAYTAGWTAGTYDFSLSITLLPGHAQKVDWQLSAAPPGTYNYSGTYTNTFALTEPPAFDQAGIMGGAALFNSPSTTNTIRLNNVVVTLTRKK